MKLENLGIDDLVLDLKPLDHIMGKHAFIRAAQWDYERVTYDYKIGSKEKNITYYIRIQGYASAGHVDLGNAVIKRMSTRLLKHHLPHGVQYDEEENFPEKIVARAKNLISNLTEEITIYKKQKTTTDYMT